MEENIDIAVEEALDKERRANEEDEYGEEEKRDEEGNVVPGEGPPPIGEIPDLRA